MPRLNALRGVLIGVLLLLVSAPVQAQQQARVRRLVPILSVESIEPVVPFWMALGWEPMDPMEVDGKLAFLAFTKDGVNIHYQTLAHIEGNIAGAADMLLGSTALIYITVDDIDSVIAALGTDADVVIARRTTRWNADEIYVREPGGHIIGFAQFGRN